MIIETGLVSGTGIARNPAPTNGEAHSKMQPLSEPQNKSFRDENVILNQIMDDTRKTIPLDAKYYGIYEKAREAVGCDGQVLKIRGRIGQLINGADPGNLPKIKRYENLLAKQEARLFDEAKEEIISGIIDKDGVVREICRRLPRLYNKSAQEGANGEADAEISRLQGELAIREKYIMKKMEPELVCGEFEAVVDAYLKERVKVTDAEIALLNRIYSLKTFRHYMVGEFKETLKSDAEKLIEFYRNAKTMPEKGYVASRFAGEDNKTDMLVEGILRSELTEYEKSRSLTPIGRIVERTGITQEQAMEITSRLTYNEVADIYKRDYARGQTLTAEDIWHLLVHTSAKIGTEFIPIGKKRFLRKQKFRMKEIFEPKANPLPHTKESVRQACEHLGNLAYRQETGHMFSSAATSKDFIGQLIKWLPELTDGDKTKIELGMETVLKLKNRKTFGLDIHGKAYHVEMRNNRLSMYEKGWVAKTSEEKALGLLMGSDMFAQSVIIAMGNDGIPLPDIHAMLKMADERLAQKYTLPEITRIWDEGVARFIEAQKAQEKEKELAAHVDSEKAQ